MTEEIQKLRDQHYNSEIYSIKHITPELLICRIRVNEPFPDPVPGQYMSLGLLNTEAPSSIGSDPIKLIRKPYSISHTPGEKLNANELEFYISLVSHGELTPKLFQLNVGDKLHITPKTFGHYSLPELSSDDTIILASTGTGLAPHLAMLPFALRAKQIVILDCVRHTSDLAYADSLTAFEKKHSNVTYIPIATRDDLEKRYIQDFFKDAILTHTYKIDLDPKHTHVFLCGNPKMIGIPKRDRETGANIFPDEMGVIEILMNQFQLTIHRPKQSGNIHFEKYW